MISGKNFKKLSAALIVIVGLAVSAFVLFQVSKSRGFQFFGEIHPRVETGRKVIALTFDDGPKKGKTDEILKILKEENIRATFFLNGSAIRENKGETEKIVAAGHEIGNHGFSHQRMILVSPSFVRQEIEETDKLIRAAGYREKIHFRPPYGRKLFTLPLYLYQNERRTITWDIEPETYHDSAEDIVDYTLANTQTGSIILLHVMFDSRSASMQSVAPIIRGLKTKGYEFVTVSELLNAAGK
jgi:peptidoglycan-N-acetylglucosamine deacetylase